MRCLVIGYGSAGQRHARILKALGHEVAVVSRRGGQQYTDIFAALADYRPDYAVVASKTGDHSQDMMQLHGGVSHVLVEKPVFNEPHVFSCPFSFEVAVGYNLRFHPVVRALRERIADRELYTAQFHVGQWLPDWRPGRDYRATDVNGVLRDLSHELDLMLWLCGWPTKLQALCGKATGLDIDCEDNAMVICQTERCPSTAVSANYIDRAPRRWIHINYDGGSLEADLIGNTLTEIGPGDQRTTEQFHVDKDDTYIAMHRAMIEGVDADLLCSLDEGLRVVNLIALIESCKDVHYERAA